jgi:hypothetical protein
MQFPAQNAEPFEFARPILLLAALSFLAGFGGYVAVHPAKAAAIHDAMAAPAPHASAAKVSLPAPTDWRQPKKI